MHLYYTCIIHVLYMYNTCVPIVYYTCSTHILLVRVIKQGVFDKSLVNHLQSRETPN